MKTTLLLFTFLLGFTFTTQAQDASMWQIDKSHTAVTFEINHFFSTVPGRFNSLDGNIHFDPNNLANSKIDIVIPVSSVNTQEQKRDDHLKSEDFFNAAKYPNMKFVSSRIEKKSNTEYVAHGKLTIRDVTKDIALPFKITGQMEHPMMEGTMILGLAASTNIKRSDFGVGTGSWAATMVVGDEVNIAINMELNRMK